MSEMRDKQNNAAVPSNMQQDGTRIEVEADKPISTTRMQQLVDALNTYSNAYYFGSEPLISDAEFDALMEELSQLEQASGIVLPDSPTHRVGGDAVTAFEPHTHIARLWSLDKVKTTQELLDFSQKCRRAAGNTENGSVENPEFVLEYKFDGLTINLTYDKGFSFRPQHAETALQAKVYLHRQKQFARFRLPCRIKANLKFAANVICAFPFLKS